MTVCVCVSIHVSLSTSAHALQCGSLLLCIYMLTHTLVSVPYDEDCYEDKWANAS